MTSSLPSPSEASRRTRSELMSEAMGSHLQGEVEAGHLNTSGVDLRGSGDGRSGKTGGGTPVGDGEREPVGRRPILEGREEVAEQAGVAGAHGAHHGGRRGGGVP